MAGMSPARLKITIASSWGRKLPNEKAILLYLPPCLVIQGAVLWRGGCFHA